MQQKPFRKAAELEEKNIPFAIVTIAGTEGTVPRQSGRMIVAEDSSHFSTIGGHLIEDEAIRAAVEAIRDGRRRKLEAAAGKGRVTLMIDPVNKIRKAYIIGYGHTGKAIAETLHSIGYALYIYDINPVECPSAAEIHTGENWEGILSGLVLDRWSALVVTIHDGAKALDLIDYSEAFYAGMMASRTRVMPEKGIHAPLGLDTGAETPEEIAVSAAAEIMGAYSRASGMERCERRRRLIIVRGAGDLATAVIIRLSNAGYDVLALETEKPTQVRRNVSFAEAVYEKEHTVEGIRAVLIDDADEAFHAFDRHEVPVLIDPEGKSIGRLRPMVVVDAIMAKRNLGTHRSMAPLVIALGPGFSAPGDVDIVIETQRGHNLGRIIRNGSAAPNTGIPGNIAGFSSERVIRSTGEGVFRGIRTFGDIVRKGDTIAYVGEEAQKATIDGMIRGMLHSGLMVTEGFKIADIDPRGEKAIHTTPSDKAYAIAGGVLEAVDSFMRRLQDARSSCMREA